MDTIDMARKVEGVIVEYRFEAMTRDRGRDVDVPGVSTRIPRMLGSRHHRNCGCHLRLIGVRVCSPLTLPASVDHRRRPEHLEKVSNFVRP